MEKQRKETNEKKEVKEETEAKASPEQKFSAGAINASVWRNETISKAGNPVVYYTVSLQRRYKVKDGEWKSSGSMRVTDLPKAVLVLNKAYEYIMLKDWSEVQVEYAEPSEAAEEAY